MQRSNISYFIICMAVPLTLLYSSHWCWCYNSCEVVNFLRCALKVKLLSRITPTSRGVVLTRTFWVSIKINGFQVLSFDHVEKGHTSLLSAFNFSFHSRLQVTTDDTTDWAAASASSFFWVVVRIETSSAKRAISASSLSEEAKSLTWKRTSKGARTEPWGRPWLKRRLELRTLKS